MKVISAEWPLEFLSLRASLNCERIFSPKRGLLVVILLSLSLKSVIIVSYAIFAPCKNSFWAWSSNLSEDVMGFSFFIFSITSLNWPGALPSNPVLLPKIPLSLKK